MARTDIITHYYTTLSSVCVHVVSHLSAAVSCRVATSADGDTGWYWKLIGYTEDNLIACDVGVPHTEITFLLKSYLKIEYRY